MDDRILPFPDFLRDGGETGALIQTHDWGRTPIGPVAGWPQSLRTTVGLMLRSPVPMVLLWGEHGVMIYNDPYSIFAAGRHPRLLGSNVLEGWPEVADFNANVMRVGMNGGTLSYRDQELTLYRNGAPEQVWMNLDYSPVLDESGRPGGILAIVVETTERARAEAALRVERNRAQDVLDNMGEAFVLIDRDFRIIDLNAEAMRLEGRPREDVLGNTVWEAHPNANPDVGDLYRVAMAEQRPVTLEHRYLWPDGRDTWIDMRAYPVGNGLAVFYRDITERKQTAEALRRSREELQLLTDALPVLVSYLELSPELRYRFVNKIYEEWFPHRRADIEGKLVREVVGERAYAGVKAFVDRALAGEHVSFEHFMRYKEGGFRHILGQYVPRFDDDGRVTGIYALVQDITQAKQVEAALRESEARFRNMADHAPVMMWVTDQDGACTYLNRRWYEFTGQSEEQALGFGWLDAAHPDDRAEAERVFLEANEKHVPFRLEYRLRDKDGLYRWAIDAAAPRFDLDGRFLGYIGSVIDIQDRRIAEEHQRLLINELNHRVKNTLATVQSIANQTLRNAQTAAEAKDALEGRLLALSRAHDVLTRENWEGADLLQIVEQAVAAYSSRGEDRLHLKGPKVRLPPRMALALAMALQELATNAVKYGALSNATGEIRIEWSLRQAGGERRLRLVWRESGGPEVREPTRRGFGTRLIQRSLAQDLGGDVQVVFAPTGLVCTVDAALPSPEDWDQR